MMCDQLLYRLLALVVIVPSLVAAVTIVAIVVASSIKPKPIK